MNIADVVIILLLLMGALIGFKKGFTRQLVDTVGTVLVVILSFLLKGYLSAIFYQYLPFFNFSGRLAGITTLNLLLYEVLAFLFLYIMLSSILRVLKSTTKTFEQLLKMTIVLGIPSKILGAVVGVIQNFIVCFILLYFMSLPIFQMKEIGESNLAQKILGSTPVLSNFCNDTLDVFYDFEEILKKYENDGSHDEINQEALDLLVDKNFVDRTQVEKLIIKGKLKNVKLKEA